MRRALGLALVLAASTTISGASSADAGCVLVNVPAVGPACPDGNGLWRVPVGDGLWVTTHGGDALVPVPGDKPVNSIVAANLPTSIGGWPLVKPACVTDGESQFHHRVVYARADDRPDRIGEYRNAIRAMIYASNGWLRRMSARFDRKLDYRVLCASNDVTVASVRLSTRDDSTTFGTIVADLNRQGYSSPFAKYWVFYDGDSRGGAAGVGTIRADDTASADNANNFGPGYAVTFNVGIFGAFRTMMHENGHNLGAVQSSSPNSNKVGHCIDGLDVMCYYERQGLGTLYKSTKCRQQDYDCRSDDYFNPVPKKGSYLATHWNTGSPMNRFIAGCVYRAGTLDVPGNAAAPVPGVTTADISIPSACRGRPFSLSAVPRYPSVLMEAILGASPAYLGLFVASEAGKAQFPDADVCFYKGDTLIRCHERRGLAELATTTLSRSATATEYGTIPSTATKARIFLAAGAAASWVFNAV